MLKKFSLFTVALLSAVLVHSQDLVKVTPTIDPDLGNGNNPRSPVLMPEFYLDGYTLTAGSYTVGSTVVLKDEDGEVVFTSYIYVEGDTITLPSTLSGTYTIEVTRGSLTFVGEIEL